jgi:hypothetical protein
MATFSMLKPPAPGSLKRRRAVVFARRLTAAICAGLAVLFGLEAVLASVETETVVVASRPIARGETIMADDVRLAEMPKSSLSPSMVGKVKDVMGRIAQIDIAPEDPMLKPMARNAPITPDGFTVIEVRLASEETSLITGDTIALDSAIGCANETAVEAPQSCKLVERAIVMEHPGKPSGNYDENPPVSLAMPPEDALRVMASQEAGAIIAVARQSPAK